MIDEKARGGLAILDEARRRIQGEDEKYIRAKFDRMVKEILIRFSRMAK